MEAYRRIGKAKKQLAISTNILGGKRKAKGNTIWQVAIRFARPTESRHQAKRLTTKIECWLVFIRKPSCFSCLAHHHPCKLPSSLSPFFFFFFSQEHQFLFRFFLLETKHTRLRTRLYYCRSTLQLQPIERVIMKAASSLSPGKFSLSFYASEIPCNGNII